MPHRNDVVLVGPPRSGTTLSCELLNEVPDTVALDEPLDRSMFPGPLRRPRVIDRRRQTATFLAKVDRFYRESRESILAGHGALSLNVGGEVTGGKFPDELGASGLRESRDERSIMKIDKPLSADFVLAVKELAGFTVMLPALKTRYPCFAIVRNPLSIIASWNTVAHPANKGHIWRAERMDKKLERTLAATEDVVDRQITILDWFFRSYHDNLPDASVIRYEDIVSTGGKALAAAVPRANELDRSLASRNRSPMYEPEMFERLAERVLGTDGAWWNFYERSDVRALMGA